MKQWRNWAIRKGGMRVHRNGLNNGGKPMDDFIYLTKKQVEVAREKDEFIDTYKGWEIYFQVSNGVIQTATICGYGIGLGRFCRYANIPKEREDLVSKIQHSVDCDIFNSMVYKRLFKWIESASLVLFDLDGCFIKVAKNQATYLLKEMPSNKLLENFSFEFNGEEMILKQQ